ncbi:MAG: PEP-CTERM sorting domain-containing protein [Rubrivivax sp.]|nr:PEP-CTERM sorting domain-containing protein [Rubrivivax sp.]
MKRTNLAALFAAVVTAAALPTTASAGIVWTETGPTGAGDLLATAQTIYDSSFNTLDEIRGSLTTTALPNGPIYQVDLYKFRIYDFANFSARTVSSELADDTALYLFNDTGFGVYMNDDNAGDFLSTLPAGDLASPLSNGIYYLAVALGGYLANDALSNSLFQAGNFSDVLGGSGFGPLNSWTPGFTSYTEPSFAYDILLTGATNVPEPASIALVLAGGIGAWLSRRRSPKVETLCATAA